MYLKLFAISIRFELLVTDCKNILVYYHLFRMIYFVNRKKPYHNTYTLFSEFYKKMYFFLKKDSSLSDL
ncbi:hypothetical protein EB354_01535 [Chryseobacterium balustinum]|nr:hypothetical protein EB354_01535 [Chryseobacterium balustinum]